MGTTQSILLFLFLLLGDNVAIGEPVTVTSPQGNLATGNLATVLVTSPQGLSYLATALVTSNRGLSNLATPVISALFNVFSKFKLV